MSDVVWELRSLAVDLAAVDLTGYAARINGIADQLSGEETKTVAFLKELIRERDDLIRHAAADCLRDDATCCAHTYHLHPGCLHAPVGDLLRTILGQGNPETNPMMTGIWPTTPGDATHALDAETDT